MHSQKSLAYSVAIVGAGPAGLYAARQLAAAGVRVVLLNRDIKPGGLAEYGIYPDKFKMKEGLRTQFRRVLDLPQVEYFGNVCVGEDGDVSLNELRGLGFDAILITVGAQATKWLGLPGEDLKGVYHAKDVVYHYNRLPPFGQRPFPVGRRVAIVGAGNVMMDIAHWLTRQLQVDEVVVVVRRGPAEVKFDKREFEIVAANLDRAALDAELARVAPFMQAIGQDPDKARANILAALPQALAAVSGTCIRFEFLASPTRVVGGPDGRVAGLEIEDNTLVRVGADTKARGLGTRRVIDVESVIFAIGDRVDASLGLPLAGLEFARNPEPRFPVEGVSYEAFDPQRGSPLEGIFLAGWARVASTGLVGVARKDGERGARAVLEFLKEQEPCEFDDDRLRRSLATLEKPVVTWNDVKRLEEVERGEALRRGLEGWKFSSNEEMLHACGKQFAVESRTSAI